MLVSPMGFEPVYRCESEVPCGNSLKLRGTDGPPNNAKAPLGQINGP